MGISVNNMWNLDFFSLDHMCLKAKEEGDYYPFSTTLVWELSDGYLLIMLLLFY